MTFPFTIDLFGLHLNAHAVAEVVAYTGGFQLYLFTRRYFPRSQASADQMMWVIVGAAFGALAGSKTLAWLESFDYYRAALAAGNVEVVLGGKTVVGGLLGGWAGVELTKWLVGVRRSTGDAFVFPLIFGQCVGRVGCFLTGLDDHTHGTRSSLPWAVDFGDGPRHPTQLYEIAFLLALAAGLWAFRGRGWANGAMFRVYLLAYLLFRLGVEFIKPVTRQYLGLSAIQVACVAGAVVLCWQLRPRQDTPVAEPYSEAAVEG